MPLGKGVSADIRELMADNKKKGKERGAKGKPRSRKQIIAIALASNRRKKKPTKKAKGGRITYSTVCRKR